MSKVILQPNFYLSSEYFNLENEKIFKTSWLFGCFTTEISEKNDFIIKKFPFGEIVIRNFNGEFKAFFNICAHRFSKLFLANKGNSIIECPYHGWRYNDQGKAQVIPNKKECFGIDFSSDRYSLIFLDTSVCGKFIFVRFNTEPSQPSLSEFLGNMYDYLNEVSRKMGDKIDENKMSIGSNWKLIIENSLEDYHLNCVHKETLAKLLSPKYHSQFNDNTSSTNIELLEGSGEKMKKMSVFFEHSSHAEGYQHEFIFPNLAVATTNGVSFFVQEAIPVTADQTTYVSHGFLTPFKTNISEVIKIQISNQFKTTNQIVFKEDAEICEGIQIALKSAVSLQGIMGTREERILHFQNRYLKSINN